MLQAEGARVLLTRRDASPVDLWPRVRFADSVNADLLVSIHNNALPDGINPFTNSGSSVFYFHRGLPSRAPSRRAVAAFPRSGVAGRPRAVRGTGCPRSGRGMFAVPEQEASGPAGREAYADAVRAGIRAFLAGDNVR
jgi:N-acetylmuramoyl-L-alanine amidase